ncbi:MAG: radical SAM protein [Lachnospiraceae bacterium]|nr:radical SAM protein [Lachnospiraceae bacterium]
MEKLEECEKFPKYVEVETTDRCNAQCPMCTKAISKNEHISVMGDALFEKIVNELKDYTEWIEGVTIQWMGEPLLDRNLEDRIKALKDIGIKKVMLSTNASLLNETRCENLLKAGLDDLRLSIDSIKKETYQIVRHGLNYETVMENALNAIKVRDKVRPQTQIRVRMIDLEETHDEIDEWLRFWNQHLQEGDLAQVMPQHTTALWNNNTSVREHWIDEPCISLFSTAVINAGGKVGLCCIDTELDNEIGDINRNSIKEIWNSEKIKKYRQMHLDGNRNDIVLCRGCDCWNRSFREEE